jgi:hypothetical protein
MALLAARVVERLYPARVTEERDHTAGSLRPKMEELSELARTGASGVDLVLVVVGSQGVTLVLAVIGAAAQARGASVPGRMEARE